MGPGEEGTLPLSADPEPRDLGHRHVPLRQHLPDRDRARRLRPRRPQGDHLGPLRPRRRRGGAAGRPRGPRAASSRSCSREGARSGGARRAGSASATTRPRARRAGRRGRRLRDLRHRPAHRRRPLPADALPDRSRPRVRRRGRRGRRRRSRSGGGRPRGRRPVAVLRRLQATAARARQPVRELGGIGDGRRRVRRVRRRPARHVYTLPDERGTDGRARRALSCAVHGMHRHRLAAGERSSWSAPARWAC